MKTLTPIERLAKMYGGYSQVALALGIERTVVYYWFMAGRIPYARGLFVEKKTKNTADPITASDVWQAAAKARPLQKPKRRHP